jgi:hypothetical protein
VDGGAEMLGPPGTHSVLGSLMLQGFPSVPTVASVKAMEGGPKTVGVVANGNGNSNSKIGNNGNRRGKGAQQRTDRAPRVPSPSPLPSLAQMAWERSDPDYRSPTYSIYGFMRQRKSVTAGETY